MKPGLKPIVAAIALACGMTVAQAQPNTALYLTMDGSGSISVADFTTQITSYVNALNNVFTANPSLYGQVAIGGGIFGANFYEFFLPTAITNSTILGNLTTAISSLDPGRAGIDTTGTAIGDAVTASALSLVAYKNSQGENTMELVIDVTTDGQNNVGADPATVVASLVPPPTKPLTAVNCLGIGVNADCTWVTGYGTNFGSPSFPQFQAALSNKLTQEFKTPEPGTLALAGLAMTGLFGLRRRSTAA
ncbi:DUF1194 domain-containing protein [Accumulibacter sp.]|nr:DUF1194 domain-containing protein [Accumulibacter sp.]MCM8594779.1 DUF1194 domain-containing protein [Accumulibacter sp.]MDS4048924.1 DUF1194 domain-containing protein [Accumulibacter sp.]